MRFWRRWRKRRGYREHALCDVEVRGIKFVQQAMQQDLGVLITPNHPSHADPFVLLEAADQLQTPLYFMTAWQVFAGTHAVGRRVLRQHGCFSINREGNDVRAVRQAVRILQNAETPLVIFPEGEVFHLNDWVTPFRRGAVQSAVWAADRSGRSVAIVPCGMKFQFIADPAPALAAMMTRLENAVGCTPSIERPLVSRIERLGEFIVTAQERELIGSPQRGPLQPRIARLIEAVLRPLEQRYQLAPLDRAPPERVKRLRHRVIRQLETPETEAAETADQTALQQDLQQLFLATQLYSYRVDYLAGDPPIERVAETIEKLEEDVFGVGRASPPAQRRAIVAFDQPLIVHPQTLDKESVARLTGELERRVQAVIDRLNQSSLSTIRPAEQPLATALLPAA